jgi:hypothetical protein
MPVAAQLVGVPGAQDGAVFEVATDDLQPDR